MSDIFNSTQKRSVLLSGDIIKWSCLLLFVFIQLVTITGSAAFETMSLMTELRPRVLIKKGKLLLFYVIDDVDIIFHVQLYLQCFDVYIRSIGL